MKHFYSSLVACVLLAANLPILAETTTSGLKITARTVGKCGITSITNLAFKTDIPTPISIIQEAHSVIVIFCSSAVTGLVSLNQGEGSGATCNERRMTQQGGTGLLKYQLYRDDTGSTVFGDGATCGATQPFSYTDLINVYGRLVVPQSPAPGLYSDTITATVTF